ncbi:hypothetical protein [Mycolicibacterium sp.]|uniref:hypothetical protein n=1 Tax=Mycolicibacterium sp. TaxID=2320850 RepID=UPI001A32B7BB|nr:hypothetical protein [Mycolicibacterium sp.]MBJ7338642.1 hypothetical protein [Mycolicibacterium sp.]
MPDSPPTASRPRTVTAAVWCWLVAAVLTAAFGMLIASFSTALFFQVAGVILVIVGLAQGFLAGRTRIGLKRFASAGVGLALASVAYLAVLLILGGVAVLGVLIVALIMILLITGSALTQRAASQQWFDGQAVS